MCAPRVIYWHRNDLRLHDSPALHAALELKPSALYPVCTVDPQYVYRCRMGVNRWQFLLDCQTDLANSYLKLSPKQKLFILRAAPGTIFPILFKVWKPTHLVFERDTDPYALDRDAEITRLAEEAGVKVISKIGRSLYDPFEIVEGNAGKPTMSITQLQKAANSAAPIPEPLPTPKEIPDPGDIELENLIDMMKEFEPPKAYPDNNASARVAPVVAYGHLAGPERDFAIPKVSDFGFPKATTPHHGGETIALKTLDEVLSNEDYTATFNKPSTAPTDFDPQSTTLMSPHLNFGTMSVRQFWYGINNTIKEYKDDGGTGTTGPPANLQGQLQFREMYFAAQAALGHEYSHMVNNGYCRFVPWTLSYSVPGFDRFSKLEVEKEAEDWFLRWKYGVTGFPFVDALMRQLRTEGWIHHLGRHMVASFLTRGGCYANWERGAEVFEEWLVDHERSSNVGNWQWLSCSAFYTQFVRMYSPVSFGRKWDKSGALVKKFCPELEDVPNKFIYDPWKAPNLKDVGVELVELDESFIEKLRDAEKKGPGRRRDSSISDLDDGMELETDDAAGLVSIGVGLGQGKYPRPMFDFDVMRRVCIDRMKEAYDVGLYGNDPRVLDGSWPELYEEGPHDDILGEADSEGFAEDIYEEDDNVLGKKGGSGHGLSDDEGGAKQVGGETKGGDRTEDAKEGDGRREEQEGRGRADKRSRTRR